MYACHSPATPTMIAGSATGGVKKNPMGITVRQAITPRTKAAIAVAGAGGPSGRVASAGNDDIDCERPGAPDDAPCGLSKANQRATATPPTAIVATCPTSWKDHPTLYVNSTADAMKAALPSLLSARRARQASTNAVAAGVRNST